MIRALTRLAAGAPAAPVRLVHLGLGAFHRAHQAWWTAAVDPHNEWGIAAFSGRSPAAAEVLAGQDGLFSLINRGAEADTAVLVTSISEAVDGARLDRLTALLAVETTAAVTLTVTEVGYRLLPDGRPDERDPVMAADLARSSPPLSPLGRLVAGLDHRRRSSGAPIAIVPCDNIPGNAGFVRTGILAIAERTDLHLAGWIAESVSVVSTSVDRITPRPVYADRGTSERLTGWADVAPVVTEPFHDWILSGSFPAGRPAWERAGAVFVDDIEPFENRKLWLLNGAHSLLAYLGQLRGHTLVAEAITDAVCRDHVVRFWAEAKTVLANESLGLDEYCAALLARFENQRIRHELAQIGADGVTKLRLRVVPVARAERAAGRDASGSAAVVAAWIAAIAAGLSGVDSAAAAIAAAGTDVRALVALLDVDLATDSDFVAMVTTETREYRP